MVGPIQIQGERGLVMVGNVHGVRGSRPWAVTVRSANFVAHCRFHFREDAETFRDLVLDGEHPDRAERTVLERRDRHA
jgi:hypothetical protein